MEQKTVILILAICLSVCLAVLVLSTIYFLRQWKRMDYIFIEHAGYEPETELAYGVNWAYMSSRAEEADPFTLIILLGAVSVILITGYLIIYNIFQISVVSDIRFYGLLKTIGTTKEQIRRLIRRQAFLLSAIGIPIGLLVGFGIGKLLLPFMMAIVRIPSSMELNGHRPNVCDAVLPLSELDAGNKYTYSFAVSYRVAEEARGAFEEALQDYTERNPEMAYVSSASLRKEFDDMVGIIAAIGIALAAVIALIGILNFTNAMITGVIARKREFAML